MKKKTMITIGAIAGAGLGAAIITDIIMRRSVRIEKEKQLVGIYAIYWGSMKTLLLE